MFSLCLLKTTYLPDFFFIALYFFGSSLFGAWVKAEAETLLTLLQVFSNYKIYRRQTVHQNIAASTAKIKLPGYVLSSASRSSLNLSKQLRLLSV